MKLLAIILSFALSISLVHAARSIKVKNTTNKTIKVSVYYKTVQGIWESRCGYTITPSNSYKYLTYPSGSKLATYHTTVYLYAESVDGMMIWSGDKEVRCDGKLTKMRKRTITLWFDFVDYVGNTISYDFTGASADPPSVKPPTHSPTESPVSTEWCVDSEGKFPHATMAYGTTNLLI